MKLIPSPSPAGLNMIRWLVMTLAVGMIALSAVALACAPTAAPSQETPTVEPTATTAPTATLYLINNGTPWPVDHPPVQKWKNLDYHLEQLYTESTAAGGDSRQRSATPEQELLLTITTDPAHIKSIVKFLKDNNVRATYGYRNPPPPNDGYGTDEQLSVVLPVSLLARLAELPGVVLVYEESRPGEVGVIDVGFHEYASLATKAEVPTVSGDNAVKRRCYNSVGIASSTIADCASRVARINHGTAVA